MAEWRKYAGELFDALNLIRDCCRIKQTLIDSKNQRLLASGNRTRASKPPASAASKITAPQ